MSTRHISCRAQHRSRSLWGASRPAGRDGHISRYLSTSDMQVSPFLKRRNKDCRRYRPPGARPARLHPGRPAVSAGRPRPSDGTHRAGRPARCRPAGAMRGRPSPLRRAVRIPAQVAQGGPCRACLACGLNGPAAADRPAAQSLRRRLPTPAVSFSGTQARYAVWFPVGTLGNAPNGTLGISLVPYAVNSWLVNLVLPASHPPRTDSGPPVTPFPIGTGGGA